MDWNSDGESIDIGRISNSAILNILQYKENRSIGLICKTVVIPLNSSLWATLLIFYFSAMFRNGSQDKLFVSAVQTKMRTTWNGQC